MRCRLRLTFACLALLFSSVGCQSAWLSSNESAERTEQTGAMAQPSLRIHFKKPGHWNNADSPRIHYWSSAPASAGIPDTRWPGALMTPEGNGWFVFALEGATSTHLVFNNNPSPQTGDLFREGEGWYDNGVWHDANPDAPPPPPPDGGYELRDNATLLQAFDWYIKDPSSESAPYTQQPEPESNLWEYVAAEKAETFYQDYFTHVWLPPSGKAFSPDTSYNSGYAVYDHYDLGEFHQMGRVRTKYGTKQQLQDAVKALHDRKLKVLADVVMNHMMGTDNATHVSFAVSFDPKTNTRSTNGTVKAYLDFDFTNAADPAPRGTTHSSFRWTPDMFTGMENYGAFYRFSGKSLGQVNNFKDLTWSNSTDNSEYQYLRSDIILGSDIDLAHPAVAKELVDWSKWLVNEVGFDGFRVDAVRHMHSPFVASWSKQLREHLTSIGKGGGNGPAGLYIFGENWDGWDARLDAYWKGSPTATNREFDVSRDNYQGIDRSMSLLDVPLHYAFQKVAGENTEWMDLKDLPGVGLVSKSPDAAITFVDNHDTLPTQPLASYINVHNKLQAYAFILLNEKGTPCVFYRDLYKGNFTGPYTNDSFEYLSGGLRRLLEARAKYAYGPGSYYGAPGLLGYKRAGDGRGHAGSQTSGVVYLIRQFDKHGNPTSGSSSLSIPDDGRNWQLFAGQGSRSGSTFRLEGNARYAVWVPGA